MENITPNVFYVLSLQNITGDFFYGQKFYVTRIAQNCLTQPFWKVIMVRLWEIGTKIGIFTMVLYWLVCVMNGICGIPSRVTMTTFIKTD